MLLGSAVGHGHGRIVLLALDRQVVAAEVLQRDIARLAGRFQGQRQAGRDVLRVDAHEGFSSVSPGSRFAPKGVCR